MFLKFESSGQATSAANIMVREKKKALFFRPSDNEQQK